jgi:two-component system OmpR family sensor kinase
VLLDDEPALTLADVVDLPPASTISVDGRRSGSRFRVLVLHRPEDPWWGVIALPLAETEAAINRLALTLGTAAAAIVAALVLIGWWIVRLGLRPIARVTDAAEHDHRVSLDDGRTEAGRLGRAFNRLLDDRDAAEARLRQFVADAAHELRTPLTSITGYLDVHAGGGFRQPGALESVLGRMRGESRRMAELVEDLLLLANLDHGRPLDRDEVTVADVLADAADDGRAVQPARALAVEPVAAGLTVTADERRLREVVAELVHNALAHTPPDAPVVLRGAVEHDDVVVTVEDAGPGLEPEVAARVFDRFYRGDASRSRSAGGSGLGLAIARALVEAQGGSLSLDTAPGRGCRFSVRLPT